MTLTSDLKQGANAAVAEKPPRQQVRPFNSMMVAQQQPMWRDALTEEASLPAIPGKCALIAPYGSHPDRWRALEWTDHHQPGSSYQITTNPREIDEHTVAIRTLHDVFTDYRDRAEPKSLAPDGNPCTSDTVGLLSRRPVRPA
jgi:hypothetical protein